VFDQRVHKSLLIVFQVFVLIDKKKEELLREQRLALNEGQ